MTHQLPELPFAYNALEPFIDEETMRLHHDKHHGGYVDKLNAAVENHPDLAALSIEELMKQVEQVPEDIRQAIKNNGGGHFNHSHFWSILGKDGSKEPTGKIKEEIEKAWGDFSSFKEEFTKQATGLFGSGWTWLSAKENKSDFHIHNMPLQENPYMHGHIPVLGLDVWEHAYYLKYNNRRAEYIESFWNVIDWEKVEENFSK